MQLIQDTREQLGLFPKAKKSKLFVGDYSTKELQYILCYERKSPQDLYTTLTSGHQRFKREILRAQEHNIQLIVLVEVPEESFYSANWTLPKYHEQIKRRLPSIRKMISTMQQKYNLEFVWCNNRDEMKNLILQGLVEQELTLPNPLTIQKVVK